MPARAGTLLPALLSMGSALQFFSQLQPCPNNCSILGPDPSNWTFIHDTNKLCSCNETVLFDLNIHNNITDVNAHTTIRACTANGNIHSGLSSASKATIASSELECGNFKVATNASVEVAWSGNTGAPLSQGRLDQLFDSLKEQLANGQPSCGSKVLFSKSSDGTIVGVYAGENVESSRSLDGLLGELSKQATTNDLTANTMVAQRCGKGIDGAFTMGIVLSSNGDLGLAQTILQTWSSATCVHGLEYTSGLIPIKMFTKVISKGGTKLSSLPSRNQMARAYATLTSRDTTCSTVQVASGDSCGSLASKCGISSAQFTQFNPASNLCSTIAVGQFVCCSAGSLPDLRPKPGPDGSCAQYTVQTNDFCDAIAKAHFITSQNIENFNNQTWGWQGCGNVQLSHIICLSTGRPPFPAPVSNTICGPQVPGTKPPTDFSTLAELNPCPLNSCCDIFGQCGITPDFCTVRPSVSGAPGTSAPGTAGCISNCGTDIKSGHIARYKSQNFADSADWAIDLETGLVSGGLGNDTDDNPTPSNVPLSPSITCTTLAPGATFTLTANCAKEISGLHPLTDHNQPPGPSHCTETCNLLREISGTCCGWEGSIGIPIVITPGVPLPLGLPLAPNFVPASPLKIPGLTLNSGQAAPVPFQLPGGFKTRSPLIIPGGLYPPGVPIGIPIIIPAGFVPSVPFSDGRTKYPANVTLAAPVPLSASFKPPSNPLDSLAPFFVPPFTADPGGRGLPGPVVVPAGWVSPGPGAFLVPPITYPAGAPIPPPGVVLPPGFVLPRGSAPITIPAGSSLPPDIVVPPPIADKDQTPDPNAPVVAPLIDIALGPEPQLTPH